MKEVEILDCTLRDGAYLIDKKFGADNIRGIIDGLVKAKIDYIEIGFFQDEGFSEGKTVYRNSEDAKKYIPKDKKGCEFTILADYSRFSIENLDNRMEDSIDGFRECFFKEERFDALEVCKKVKEKGYKCFVQPVDILGYTDAELIEFIEKVNMIEPYCISIVDTFGSMYQEELLHVFEIINHNLISTCKMGFHSHNNMQMSSALSQEFIRMASGKRGVIVDGTISGMGRGAGNTPTELVVQYMVSKLSAPYDIDAILDIIDNYMDNLRTRCSWGYNIEYFIAGCYGAHVNNIQYLTRKASIKSKDIRYILNKIGEIPRKRYDYDLLEKTYLEYVMSMVDDNSGLKQLESIFKDKPILVIAPGSTAKTSEADIRGYVEMVNPIVITINFLHAHIESDFVYMSNVKRYSMYKDNNEFRKCNKILASNVKNHMDNDTEIIVSFSSLIKCGWEHMDNSTILLLRLLDRINGVKSIAIAGFDGYDSLNLFLDNYAITDMEKAVVKEDSASINEEIIEMLRDHKISRTNKDVPIEFITRSRFSHIFDEV